MSKITDILKEDPKKPGSNRLRKIFQMLGLHPLVGFGMLAVDAMLFSSEMLTFGLTWPIAIAIAAALTIPCILLQKSVFGDDWKAAIGKGLLVGVLTAIPTPLPSIITGLLGGAGILKLLLPGPEGDSVANESPVDGRPMKDVTPDDANPE